MGRVIDKGGPILKNVGVQPVFWGPGWKASPAASVAQDVVLQLRRVLSGPYLMGLSQYRGIGLGTVHPPYFDFSSAPTAVGNDVLSAEIDRLVSSGHTQDFRLNPYFLYLVLTDQGHHYDRAADASGFHDAVRRGNNKMHFAWVAFPAHLAGQDLTEYIYVMTHEIAEACSDADGSALDGFVIPLLKSTAEICDVCQPKQEASDGVIAAAYWSDNDASCIVPRRIVSLNIVPDECHLGPIRGGISTIRAVLSIEPSWIEASSVRPIAGAQYSWEWDDDCAHVLGPKDGDSLTVHWQPDCTSTVIVVKVLFPDGTVSASGNRTFNPLPTQAADLLHATCVLRRYLAEELHVRPWFGPPPGLGVLALPSPFDVADMKIAANHISELVAKVAEASRRWEQVNVSEAIPEAKHSRRRHWRRN